MEIERNDNFILLVKPMKKKSQLIGWSSKIIIW